MHQLETFLYFTSAALQFIAMVYCLHTMRSASDRRPWHVLFAALSVMFVFRLLSVFFPINILPGVGAAASVVISLLLFISLFYIRRIALAERQSKQALEQRSAALKLSVEHFQLAADAGHLGTWDYNPATRELHCSDLCKQLFFLPTEVPLHYHAYLERLHPQDLARVDQDFKVTFQPTGPNSIDVEYRTINPQDNSIRWIHVVGRTIFEAGRPTRCIGTVRDITRQKLASQEREIILDSERAARTQAEHAGRLKDEFLATLSHELRTPLNAILGWAQILKLSSDPQDLTQGLDTIDRNARAQTQIIEDLLDMSRIISGKIHLDFQNVDLPRALLASLDTVRNAAHAKNVELLHTLDRHAATINADPARLQQIFWNLLTNAIKFTPKSGRILVNLTRENDCAKITVADSGEGIAAAFLPHVFDRFRQADASTTRIHGGLGLGLSIVKQLVELQGGKVHAHSPGPQQGATFSVSFPLVSTLPEIDGQPHPTLTHSNHSLRGLHVLAVDDEPDALELLRRILNEFGATVLTASSAREALQLLQTYQPHVLIADIGMPECDGYDLLRDVRALPATPLAQIPAIALTAFARPEDRQKALTAGFQLHLPKPFHPNTLATALTQLTTLKN